MGRIIIEDTEINIWEKVDEQGGEHRIEGKYYIMHATKIIDFKSTIYNYEDIAVLVSKIKRYSADYYKIVLFNDVIAKAWQLIILSEKLNVKVKRLTNDGFLVVAESPNNDVVSQVSFCRLKPSAKVEDVTVNFTKLNDIRFLDDNVILLAYAEQDNMSGKKTHVLSTYNYEGKMLKNYYEYDDDSKEKFSYVINGNKINVIKKQ